MKLTITIDMDNDAFQDHRRTEVRRILRSVTEDRSPMLNLGAEGDSVKLRDINGNTVGSAEVTE